MELSIPGVKGGVRVGSYGGKQKHLANGASPLIPGSTPIVGPRGALQLKVPESSTVTFEISPIVLFPSFNSVRQFHVPRFSGYFLDSIIM